ncbi:MAG: 2,3-bisphosphoglycerate-independent phosphoglycerate mutase [Verrucomicrobiae bacterium]|nr:2,3-bisphosphoglycerate-independent phosphoglycerate mutase [Verrucomicrobiae bacterium]
MSFSFARPTARRMICAMNLDAVYSELTLKTPAKLALVVLDGLGDLATPEQNHLTPLEAARTPNLDALARQSAQGRMIPVAPGITPGSGPGHLALFGYDPVEFQVGRGVIEALGLGVELKPGDVCARANFATLDARGIVTDRRAGRIPTETCERLCALLASKIKKIGDTQVLIKAGKEHRFVVVFRGRGLEGPVTDADPNREGLPIPPVKPRDARNAKQKKTARLVAEFYKLALPLLAKEKPANGFLMRGIAHQPAIPTFEARYQLRAACLAIYPMYKGLAQLVGMTKLEGPQTLAEQFERYLAEFDRFDFFFIHHKATDKAGEDGNFEAKKKAIEEFDAALPILLRKKPDVLVVTGDHSTPCAVRGHSWHPQPVLLHSAVSGSDKLDRFTETTANCGSLGVFEAKYLIRLMQANARMFDKFGA